MSASQKSILILLAMSLVAGGCAHDMRQTRPAGPEQSLRELWTAYQSNYMSPEGYVADPLRNGQVTSEAQSYALLQAVWLHDRSAFERVLDWTNRHLRRHDGLYSWLWDPADGGRIVDANSATDADTDIAFALIMASTIFGRPEYRDEAVQIISAIRTVASLPLRGDWFPSAGNWASGDRVINLSYFAPYAYAYFDRLDADRGWSRAIDIGYDLLEKATRGAPARLPADFLVLTAEGTVEPLPAHSTLSRFFSYDGIRIVWRIDADCRLRRYVRACAAQPLLRRLAELWARDGKLVARYSTSGRAETSEQSLSFYGALLPAMARAYPEIANRWRRLHLSERQLTSLRSATNRYYDANWVWFGLAAADGLLAARTPAIASESRKSPAAQ
jgi:endo-1,4-beta-D-glucanase Y